MRYAITSTVVTAATALFSGGGQYDLIDLATVHDELDIPTSKTSDDAFLQRAISQVSAQVAKYCNRVFPVETVRDTIYPERDAYPWQTPGGVSPLQLSRWPVVRVRSVQIKAAPGFVHGAEYRVDAPSGQLIRLDRWTQYPTQWWPEQTEVVYDAGYSTIPVDLQDAVLRLITARYYNRGRDPTLKSQTQPGLGDQTYWVGSVPGVKGPFTEDIIAILDPYRVPVTA